MIAEQRYEALAGAEAVALERLADDVLAAGPEVSVTAGPESVSTPVRVSVPGSPGTTVVLGHLALTRCTVELAGTRGDGIRAGYDPTGAVAAAVCDAEAHRGGPLAAQVDRLCVATEQDRTATARERARLVATTTLDES
ncbi:phosphonate C-P lyase system protein PhnG [Mycobacterium sp. NPDC003449]